VSRTTVFVVLVCVGIAACAQGAHDESRASNAPTTLTVLAEGGSDLLNPLYSGSGTLLYDTPFGYVAADRTGPLLVTGEERLRDGQTFRYRLRPGIRWHDGTPFTTRDIAFTWQLKQALALQDSTSRILTVEDDSTFTISYPHGRQGLPNWEVFLPAHLLADEDPARLDEWDFWQHPIGYGPYRFVRMVRHEFVELEANPDYYLGRPAIDRVVIKLGGNAPAELQAGTVDLAIVHDNRTAMQLAQDPRFAAYWYVSTKLHHLYWNLRHPILGDVRVRRALSLAVDRRAVLEALDYPRPDRDGTTDLRTRLWDRPWDVWVSPELAERGDYPDPLPHDPDAARALLDEAGWHVRDVDGMRYHGERPLEFRLLAAGGRDRIALLLQAQFQAVGARVVIDAMDGNVALARFRAADFDAALMSANGDLAEQALTGRGTTSGASYTGYRRAEFNRHFWAKDSAWVADEHRGKAAALWPYLREDLPVTLLVPQFSGMTVAHRRVRGLTSPLWAPLERIPWLRIED